jgi:hypothetical protein
MAVEAYTYVLDKWHLAENGTLTGWVPHNLHGSKQYQQIRSCYNGRTHGSHLYATSDDGHSVIEGVEIEYEYTLQLIYLKQRNVKWKWQGLYDADIVVEFDFERHIQEYQQCKPEQAQTLKQINDIITKLNEPPKEKFQLHNFRLSEGTVLCQHCGSLLSELKLKEKPGYLPACATYKHF